MSLGQLVSVLSVCSQAQKWAPQNFIKISSGMPMPDPKGIEKHILENKNLKSSSLTRDKNCIEVSIFATNRRKVLACSCQWQRGHENGRSKLERHVEDGEGDRGYPAFTGAHLLYGRKKETCRKLEPHGRHYPILTWQQGYEFIMPPNHENLAT